MKGRGLVHLGSLAVCCASKQLVEFCDKQLVSSGQVVPEIRKWMTNFTNNYNLRISYHYVTWLPCGVPGHCCWECLGCKAPHFPHPLTRRAPVVEDDRSCFHLKILLQGTCPFLLTPMMPLVGSCWAVTKIVSALILRRGDVWGLSVKVKFKEEENNIKLFFLTYLFI